MFSRKRSARAVPLWISDTPLKSATLSEARATVVLVRDG
jgi:hypothetical protein